MKRKGKEENRFQFLIEYDKINYPGLFNGRVGAERACLENHMENLVKF